MYLWESIHWHFSTRSPTYPVPKCMYVKYTNLQRCIFDGGVRGLSDCFLYTQYVYTEPAQLLHIPRKHSITFKNQLFWTVFFYILSLLMSLGSPADPGRHHSLPPPPHPLYGYTGACTATAYTPRKRPVTFTTQIQYFGLPSFIYMYFLLAYVTWQPS